MSPFLPFGIFGREVCDPDVLAEDFIEAARIASRLGPWQFKQNAFTDVDSLTPQESVRMHMLDATATLQTTPGVEPVLTGGGVDAQLWQIPYNRGLEEIGGGDVAITFTSDYPELVLSAFTFQYIRLDLADFTDTTLNIRTQIQVEWDNARLAGSGPFARPIDSKYRGAGVGQRAVRTTIVTLQMLPAGPHRIAPVAGQAPALDVNDDELQDATRYLADPPVEGVCIGNRRHIALRFGRGLWLPA